MDRTKKGQDIGDRTCQNVIRQAWAIQTTNLYSGNHSVKSLALLSHEIIHKNGRCAFDAPATTWMT